MCISGGPPARQPCDNSSSPDTFSVYVKLRPCSISRLNAQRYLVRARGRLEGRGRDGSGWTRACNALVYDLHASLYRPRWNSCFAFCLQPCVSHECLAQICAQHHGILYSACSAHALVVSASAAVHTILLLLATLQLRNSCMRCNAGPVGRCNAPRYLGLAGAFQLNA